jgi:drug/metabolite transporter (DMT)-like permease
MKIALTYATPLEFSALRCVIAAVTLFAAAFALRAPMRPPVLGTTIVIGVAQVGGFSLFTALALEAGGVGRSSILAYSFPLWVALLAGPILKERPHGFQVAAFPIALAGFAFILYPYQVASSLISAACAVAAGISWALGSVLFKWVAARTTFNTLGMTAWQGFFGSLVLCIGAVAGPHPPIHPDARFAFALFFASVVSNGLGWFLWTYALSGLSASVASFGILLSPIVGAVAAAIQLHERDPLPQLLGFGLLLAALVVFSLQGVREASGAMHLAKSRR